MKKLFAALGIIVVALAVYADLVTGPNTGGVGSGGSSGGLTTNDLVEAQIISSNFVAATVYSNSFGRAITVSANAVLTVTNITGYASIELHVIGYRTNYVSENTTVGSTFLKKTTNVISAVVPANALYLFNANNNGANNSSFVFGGQIVVPGNMVSASTIGYSSWTNNGIVTSNLNLTAGLISGWQQNFETLPWFGNVTSSEVDSSNKVTFLKTMAPVGCNVMATFEHMYAATRTGGHLVCNPTNFPMGWDRYREFMETNGLRWLQWYDSANATSEGYSTIEQFIDDITTIVTVAKPHILWVDEAEDSDRGLIAAAIVSTNKNPPLLMFGTSSSADLGYIQPRMTKYGNSWRLHGSSDVANFTVLMEYQAIMESNGWKYVGPGQLPYFGPEAGSIGTATENGTSVALQAMYSAIFCFGFNASVGPLTTLTNKAILEIQRDPAVVAARVVFNTNGCKYLLKPLKTAAGPEYALMIINTNAFTTNTAVLLRILGQNLGKLQSTMGLYAENYTVVNLKSGALVGTEQTSVTVSSLASHDYALFKLIPKTPVPRVYNIIVQACPTPTGTWTPTTSNLGIYDATVATTNTSVSRLAFPVPHGNGFTNCQLRVSVEANLGTFNNTLYPFRFQTQVLTTNGALNAGPAVDTNLFISPAKMVIVTANVSFSDDVSPRQALIIPFWANGFTNAGVSQPIWIVGIQATDLP